MRLESRARRVVLTVLSMLLGTTGLVLMGGPAYAAGTISGTLRDTFGNEVDGQIDLYRAEDGIKVDSTFAAGGPYSFASVANGTYKIGIDDHDGLYVPTYYNDKSSLEAADPIVVDGADRTGIDLTVAYVDGANTGEVSGTVTAQGGGALQDIAVTAYELDGLDWLAVDSDFTDAGGAYALDLLPGTYRVGFADATQTYAAEFHSDAASVEGADDVFVEAGETDVVDAALAPTGQVQGTVTGQADADPDPDPLNGIVATLYAFQSGTWVEAASDSTDGTGAYDLRVPAGTYRLGFADPVEVFADEYYDNVPTLPVAADVVVTSGGGLVRNAFLEKPGTLGGTVTDQQTDDPISGITVIIHRNLGTAGQPNWQQVAETTTTGTGSYQRSLDPGSYRVQFLDENEVYAAEYWNNKAIFTLADVITVPGAGAAPDADAELVAAGQVSGTVTGEGDGQLGGVTVALLDPANQFVVDEDVTDSSGDYSLTAASGSYRVSFTDQTGTYATEFYDDAPTFAEADPVVVTGGNETPNIDAELARAEGSISGEVRVSVGDEPLPGVVVEVWQNDGTPADPVWEGVANTTTGPMGRYAVEVPAGQYRLCFDDPSLEWARECYDDEQSLDSADDVQVNVATDTPGIDAVLTPSGSITGTVTTAVGDPLGNVAVQALVNRGTPAAPDWVTVGTADTDSNGVYSLRVPSGSYLVLFEDVGAGLWASEYYDDATSRAAAAPVVVDLGEETAGIDAVLARKQVSVATGPTIKGTPRVGSTLTSSVTWTPDGVTTSYQWKANGSPIAGATGPTLKLASAQVGKRISVTVTGTKANNLSAAATSAATGIVKVRPTVSVRASDRSRTVRLVVKVKAVGVAVVTGKVKVFRKSALVKTVRLVQGKVTVTLRRQPKGRQTYKVAYQGAGVVLPATKSVKVAV